MTIARNGLALAARVALLCLACFAPPAHAKTTVGTFTLEGGDDLVGPERELTKYSFNAGAKGVIMATFWAPKSNADIVGQFKIWLIRDDSWAAYHAATTCVDKEVLALQSFTIRNHEREGPWTQAHAGIFENAKDAWDYHHREVHESMKRYSFVHEVDNTDGGTRGFYVSVAYCPLEQYAPGTIRVPAVEYQVLALNDGFTHLPADEFGLPRLTLLAFLALVGYGAYCLHLLRTAHYRAKGVEGDVRKVHLVVVLLGAAYAGQVLATLSEGLHLRAYAGDGVGRPWLDHLSEFCEAGSTWVIMFVLVCLACGWTLADVKELARFRSLGGHGMTADELAGKKNDGKLAGADTKSAMAFLRDPKKIFASGLNLVGLAVVALCSLSVLLILFGKKDDDDFRAFHDHETAAGMVAAGVRLLVGVLFRFALSRTMAVSGVQLNKKLSSFLAQLRLWGTVWFAAFPALLVLTAALPHYLRHRAVTAGVLLLQCGALFMLTRLFLVRSGDYFELTTLAERGMLPSQLSDMMEGGAVSLGLANTLKKMPSVPASLAAPAAQVVKKGAQIFKKKKLAQD